MPYEHLVLSVSVAAFSAGELLQALRLRRGSARADVRAELVFRLLFFGAVLTLALGRAVVPGAAIGGGAGVFALGAVVGWAGLLLRWWSFLSLGTYFTVVVRISPDQPVVDRGPYRVLRHPGYTGLLLAFAGVGVMLGNGAGALGAVVLVLIGLLHRIRIEERALVAALGERYLAYAADRARLVPFVW